MNMCSRNDSFHSNDYPLLTFRCIANAMAGIAELNHDKSSQINLRQAN